MRWKIKSISIIIFIFVVVVVVRRPKQLPHYYNNNNNEIDFFFSQNNIWKYWIFQNVGFLPLEKKFIEWNDDDDEKKIEICIKWHVFDLMINISIYIYLATTTYRLYLWFFFSSSFKQSINANICEKKLPITHMHKYFPLEKKVIKTHPHPRIKNY